MSRKFRNNALKIAVVLIIILSFYFLDFSGRTPLTGKYISQIFTGLTHPDWSFVYQKGSNEDLLSLMWETIMIALYGTGLGTLLSIPFILLASSAIWGKFTIVPKIGKFILNIMRAIPTIIYAILFVRVVGPGPFAGGLAIGTQLVGMLGKLISNAMDNVDNTPIEALNSVGASKFQTFQYAHLPQITSISVSHILNHFEISVRSATILGLVGAGGIGAPIIFALQSRDWGKVSIILIAIIIVVLIIDALGTFIRKKLA